MKIDTKICQHIINIFVLLAILAVVFFIIKHTVKPVTVSESVSAKKIRILIVPGHEPNDGGATFGDVKERDLTVELGQYLADFLKTDNAYQIFITRDTEAWNPTFADYFKNNWDEIVSWQKDSKEQFKSLLATGVKKASFSIVPHNVPAPDVGLRIYGITKWANENNIDVAIHIHFNDYHRHSAKIAGKYSGFAIYVPGKEYSNSTMSRAIAEPIFNRISENVPVSNLKIEKAGIINDSKLIALGENDTAKIPSLLIEYGYIYEPQFTNPELRGLFLKNLAYQTYLGLEDYFGNGLGK